ncbi:hypothetical protein HBI30_213770 [Parastagonospora nodorum]|nr:hypothetical protein HBI30_213770 [Parastagonospora nodorum]
MTCHSLPLTTATNKDKKAPTYISVHLTWLPSRRNRQGANSKFCQRITCSVLDFHSTIWLKTSNHQTRSRSGCVGPRFRLEPGKDCACRYVQAENP